MKEKTTTKKRYWAFVSYPESLPDNWREIIQLRGIRCAVSPLHDRDINADGVEKKAHYHNIVAFDGPVTEQNVQGLTDALNATIPIPLDHVRGMYRYFTHQDNPEKAQYSEADIQHFNGFNIHDFLDYTATEVAQMKKELLQIIREADILEYSDFCDLLVDSEDPRVDIAMNNTLFFDRYISSRRNKRQCKAAGADQEGKTE